MAEGNSKTEATKRDSWHLFLSITDYNINSRKYNRSVNLVNNNYIATSLS